MKVKNSTPVVEEKVEVGGNQPFDSEQIRIKIDEYIAAKQPSQSIITILKGDYELSDNDQIKFVLNNPVGASLISEIEVDLLGFLRSELQNSQIKIAYDVLRSNEKRMAYTPSEVLIEMSEKNPALTALKNAFGLDPDF